MEEKVIKDNVIEGNTVSNQIQEAAKIIPSIWIPQKSKQKLEKGNTLLGRNGTGASEKKDLQAFLKQKCDNYRPKISKVLLECETDKFITETLDDIYLMIKLATATSYEETVEEVAEKFANLTFQIEKIFYENDRELRRTRIYVEKSIALGEAFLQVQLSQLENIVQIALEQSTIENRPEIEECGNVTLSDLNKLGFNSLQTCRDSPELKEFEEELINLNKTKQKIDDLHQNCLDHHPNIGEDLLKCANAIIQSIELQGGQFREEALIFIANWVDVAKNCIEIIGKSIDLEIDAMAHDFKDCIKSYVHP